MLDKTKFQWSDCSSEFHGLEAYASKGGAAFREWVTSACLTLDTHNETLTRGPLVCSIKDPDLEIYQILGYPVDENIIEESAFYFPLSTKSCGKKILCSFYAGDKVAANLIDLVWGLLEEFHSDNFYISQMRATDFEIHFNCYDRCELKKLWMDTVEVGSRPTKLFHGEGFSNEYLADHFSKFGDLIFAFGYNADAMDVNRIFK